MATVSSDSRLMAALRDPQKRKVLLRIAIGMSLAAVVVVLIVVVVAVVVTSEKTSPDPSVAGKQMASVVVNTFQHQDASTDSWEAKTTEADVITETLSPYTLIKDQLLVRTKWRREEEASSLSIAIHNNSKVQLLSYSLFQSTVYIVQKFVQRIQYIVKVKDAKVGSGQSNDVIFCEERSLAGEFVPVKDLKVAEPFQEVRAGLISVNVSSRAAEDPARTPDSILPLFEKDCRSLKVPWNTRGGGFATCGGDFNKTGSCKQDSCLGGTCLTLTEICAGYSECNFCERRKTSVRPETDIQPRCSCRNKTLESLQHFPCDGEDSSVGCARKEALVEEQRRGPCNCHFRINYVYPCGVKATPCEGPCPHPLALRWCLSAYILPATVENVSRCSSTGPKCFL